MKYRWLIIILVYASLSCQGCAAVNDKDIAADTQPTPTAIHSLGDVQERTRDGMPMVYVPGGDFMMGSDYLGTAYARQLCFEYSKTDAVVNKQNNWN